MDVKRAKTLMIRIVPVRSQSVNNTGHPPDAYNNATVFPIYFWRTLLAIDSRFCDTQGGVGQRFELNKSEL